MIGVIPGPRSMRRLRLPQALAVTLQERLGVFRTWALSEISTPLLLTSPKFSNRVVLTPNDGASLR